MKPLALLALFLVACDGSAYMAPEQGPPGPPGERGARGPAGASCAPPTTYVVRVSGPANLSLVAYCEEGDALTGGYCQPGLDAELVQGGPVEDPAGWWCYATSEEPHGVADVWVYAICLER